MKKNILVYSLGTTYPESKKTITPKFIHTFNKELVKLGFRVVTITPHLKGALTKENIDSVEILRFRYFPEDWELDRTPISDVVNNSKAGFLKVFIMIIIFFLYTFFVCLKKKPDIIHAHWIFPCGYIAYIVSKFLKLKVITTAYGGEIPQIQKFNFLKKIVVPAMNKTNMIIVPSTYIKNELGQLGFNNEKIKVMKLIPNFLDHTSDFEFLKKIKSKFTNPENKIVFFVGRLVERKGVKYLIQSLLEMKTKNIHLIICGKGYLSDELKALTKSLSLDNKVTFIASDHKELGYIHDISDCFVLPSVIDCKGETEGLGLVILEAMESGVPVVASAVGGITDIIKHEYNGLLVEQKNPKAIADAVDRVLSDEQLRKKLVTNVKITAKEFSPQTVAEQYTKIFHQILN